MAVKLRRVRSSYMTSEGHSFTGKTPESEQMIAVQIPARTSGQGSSGFQHNRCICSSAFMHEKGLLRIQLRQLTDLGRSSFFLPSSLTRGLTFCQAVTGRGRWRRAEEEEGPTWAPFFCGRRLGLKEGERRPRRMACHFLVITSPIWVAIFGVVTPPRRRGPGPELVIPIVLHGGSFSVPSELCSKSPSFVYATGIDPPLIAMQSHHT